MTNNRQYLPTGTLLHNGAYQIEKVLGQGGFGITYLAHDRGLERYVAIKEFFPKEYCERDGDTSHVTLGTQSNRDFIERLKAKFLKEARNIAKFDCPGIIKIHAAFEENGTAYYVMDYIEGMSLAEMVKSRGKLAEGAATNYIIQVGEALEYVHARHMNHLDVKPANIMVRDRDNQPILIDFGLSKKYDQEGNQTSTTPLGISHGYAPMEQYTMDGVREFSPRTDLYSLAATFYYLVSGQVPPNAQEVFDEGLCFPAGFPSQFKDAVSRAMSAAKKHRHESVREFLWQLTGTSESPAGENPLDSTRIMDNRREEETVFPGRAKDAGSLIAPAKKSNIIWIAVGGAVIIIALIIGWLYGGSGEKLPPMVGSDDESVTTASMEGSSDYEPASQEERKAAIQLADDVKAVILPGEESRNDASAHSPQVRYNTSDPYVVVVGSRNSYAEAMQYINILEGTVDLPMDITESEGRYRIYVATGRTTAEAKKQKSIVTKYFPDAWVAHREEDDVYAPAAKADPEQESSSSLRCNDYDPYILVVASQSSYESAQNYIRKEIAPKTSWPCSIIESNGNYRVYIASAATKGEADRLRRIIARKFPKVWIAPRY